MRVKKIILHIVHVIKIYFFNVIIQGSFDI